MPKKGESKKSKRTPAPAAPEGPAEPIKAEEVCEFCGVVATKEDEMCSHLRAKHGLPLKGDPKSNQDELPGMPPKGEEALIAEDILDQKDKVKAERDKLKLLTNKFIGQMRLVQKSHLLVKGWNFDVDLKDTLTVTKKK